MPLFSSAPTVRYIPDAIADHAARFTALVRDLPWDDRIRARRTASVGRPYDYSGLTYPAAPIPPLIAEVAEVAARHAGHGFDNCLANFYATGDRTMGFHADSYDRLVPTSWIAIVSLGAARPLVFRSRDRRTLVQHDLAPGSLLLMDRATQDAWTHAVPRADAGPRISLTFRQFA